MNLDSILVVDDSPDNVELIRILLESEGFEVRSAGDAAEALETLRTYRPGLILMDVQLPGMDGLELTRLLRRNEELRDIPILALTAYAMKGDEDKALEAGCDGYAPKPIDTRTFPLRVREFLASARAGRGVHQPV